MCFEIFFIEVIFFNHFEPKDINTAVAIDRNVLSHCNKPFYNKDK